MSYIGKNPNLNTLKHNPQSADPTNPVQGQTFYSDGTPRAEGLWVYNGSDWEPVGQSAGSLDIFHQEDFEVTVAADIDDGNDATFLGGLLTLDGTLDDETTNKLSGRRSLKYTMSTSSTNDYFAVPVVTIQEKQQQNDIGISFYYTYDGDDDDITFVVYDDTNNEVISSPLDTLKTAESATRFSTSVYIPDAVTELRFGFQVTTGNNTKILIVDDVELSTNPFVYKNILDENNVRAEGNAGTSLTANVTDIDFTEVEDLKGLWDGTTFTAPKSGYYEFDGSVFFTTDQTGNLGLYVDGTLKRNITDWSPGAQNRHVFTITEYLEAEEEVTIRFAQSATLSNNTTSHYLSITSLTTSENVITPATSTLTDWIQYTPTTQGLGFVSSVNVYYREVGGNLEIKGYLTTGTTSGTEFQLGLPTGFTVDNSVLPAISLVGNAITNGSTTNQILMLATGNDAFLNAGNQTAATPLNPLSGSGFFSSSIMTFFASVPVTELDSNASFLAAVPVQKVAYINVHASDYFDNIAATAAYKTRNLDSVIGDSEIVSIASDQLTLGRGKYALEIPIGVYGGANHANGLIYNITDVANHEEFLKVAFSSVNNISFNTIFAEIEITESKTFEIRTKADVASGNEYISRIKITKLR
jgi:hypothetical protein